VDTQGARIEQFDEESPAFGYPAEDRRVGAGGRPSRAIERCGPSFIPGAKRRVQINLSLGNGLGYFHSTTVAGFAASSATLPIVAARSARLVHVGAI
jgi:hypothetical protein